MADGIDCHASRYQPASTAGHYESYFQRGNHPDRPLAFWTRYTVFQPKGKPDAATGELWAVYFDGERQTICAAKEVWPIAACQVSGSVLDVRIGPGHLTADRLHGQARSEHHIEWDLQCSDAQAPLLLLPAAFYQRAWPKAKALVSMPNALFQGALVVDGKRIEIDGWRGSQNHNWGSQHTDAYAWGQVAGFDNAPEAFLECSTARLRFGPLWSPPISVLVLRCDGREYACNSLGTALRARARRDDRPPDGFDWQLDTACTQAKHSTSSASIRMRMHAPPAAFVGLRYANPPGGSNICLNTKLASCELRLSVAGQPDRLLYSQQRAAFEILTSQPPAGIAVQM
jgi:hypothetical protein